MANKVSGIYVILNTKNGKVYIGQAEDFRKRWVHHTCALNGDYHGNTYLQNAWNKYGAKSFKFQKLEYCEIEQLDDREQHYLDIYMQKGMCYNLAKDARSPGRGRIVSDETRRKLSNSGKGRIVSDETRRKVSAVHKGKIVNDETRRKMKESHKNISDETRRKLSESLTRYQARRRAEREAAANADIE